MVKKSTKKSTNVQTEADSSFHPTKMTFLISTLAVVLLVILGIVAFYS